MKYLKFLFLLLVSIVSAQNYQYSLDTPKVLEPQQIEEESSLVRIIPQDFDWENIPLDYSDSVWEIRYDFDFAGQTIILPANVTVRFNGGVLENGTLRGDAALIESNSENQLFEELTLEGSFKSEYLKPQWFGAAMNDATDDREDFVETLDQAENIGAKVLVDRNMFLDLEETGKKSIFLADNTWLEGANDAHIRINNLLSPAFYMALTKNITITNVTFLYDQQYDAAFGWSYDSNTLNIKQLRGYLTDSHNIIFNGVNPIWRGPILFRSTFVIDGGENIEFKNVEFIAKGQTADKFIQMAIKLKEEYIPNQKVENETEPTKIPKNISLENITLDGVIMGVQGIVDTFVSKGMKSHRYSDAQNADGNYIGMYNGKDYDFPPPHLIYLNHDDAKKLKSKNIIITKTYDYGEYVGTEKVRGLTGVNIGYCNSLKLVEDIDNVKVDDYKSYRRDGFADIGDLSNSSFNNIYAEYDSQIFDISMRFVSLRFVGVLKNVSFNNITLKDNAPKCKIYPIDISYGDYVSIDNLQLYVKESGINSNGPFSIFGSNNSIKNSGLHIEKHTASKDYLGLIFLDENTSNNGTNNFYDVDVTGWRNFSEGALNQNMNLTFLSDSNLNSNFAKITDIDHDFIIQEESGTKKINWSRTELVELGNGDVHQMQMQIPHGFSISHIEAETLESLTNGITVSVGSSMGKKDNILSKVSSSVGAILKDGIEDSSSLEQRIYLFGDSDFNNKGKIKISIELIRIF